MSLWDQVRSPWWRFNLANPGFFSLVAPDDERELRRICVRCRFARGAYVFHQGEAGDCLHVVERGKVAVEVGGLLGDPLMLTILREGDAFGEGALLARDQRRTASIVALERTETLRLRARDYDELCRRRPDVHRVLSQALAGQVRRLSTRVVELAEIPAPVRVYRRLVELGDLYGVADSDRPIPLTQGQLASLSMVKLRLVNRVVAEAKQLDILETKRGRLVVHDWTGLRERAAVGTAG
jgi:CRP-like cAMP-binding protein